MKFENTEIFNFEGALRGMRNPFESWLKSDSYFNGLKEKTMDDVMQEQGSIGENDLKLAQRLIRAGSTHRKFLRQIFVSVDITAPLYWWKEFDTYKVGTVANSCSTMHRLANTPITLDCFEFGKNEDVPVFTDNRDIPVTAKEIFSCFIDGLEVIRWKYNETKDKKYWRALIQLLPSSWLQKRTVTMTYENILSMIEQRENHRLREWSVDFIEWAKTLNYADKLLFGGKNE